MPNTSGIAGRIAGGLSMPTHLIGFGAFTPASSLLDGSESDGTNLLAGGPAAFTSGWTTLDVALTANNAVAPNGATEAARVLESATTARHGIYTQPTINASNAHTASVYAKAITRQYLQMYIVAVSGSQGAVAVYFDIINGTVTDSEIVVNDSTIAAIGTPTIEAAVNGFYKCTVPDIVLNNTDTAPYWQWMCSDAATYGGSLDSNNPIYAGNAAYGVYLWRPKFVVA